MFRNYFKTAWRNLWKNKTFSLINISGLAIGMATCILIMLFVFYERNFDNFHSKNIYRLNEVQKFEGMLAAQKVALSMFPMGPTLKAEFPEIKNFTRINWATKVQMTYGEKRLFLPQTFFVDSTFLQIFDFKLIKGERATALQKPNSAVLTEKSAEKIFGKENPLGKTITHYAEDTLTFTVTGVVADPPSNSQLQFDALFSFNTIYKPNWMEWWGGNWLDTYFVLAPNTNVKELENKFPAYLKRHMKNDGWKNYELFLLPFRDVHANSADIGLDYVNYQKFDKTYTNIFAIIAVIVLVIACINFMNLSTARSAERAREVGIRKSVGAYRWQLGTQFIGESVILALLSLLIAILLVKIALPYVNNLSQRELTFPIFSNLELILSVLLGTILVGIISGLYPALYLSSFEAVKVLKGSIQTGKNKGRLRNILVVGQFTSAIFLIIATVFAVRQLRYMQDRDPGFNREEVITVPLDGITSRKYDILKEKLLENSLVAGVTGAQDVLGSHLDQSGIEFKGDTAIRNLTSTRLIVDPDYLRVFKLAIIAGRDFINDKTNNGKEYIINEALAKELLRDHPKAALTTLLGKQFGFRINDTLGTIVGIARDFNFNTMHYKIETMFMFNQTQWGFSNLSVRINGQKPKEAIAFVQSTWNNIYPDHPFEYQFLDDHFEEMYRADATVSKSVGILAVISIIVSCLGLFGLASYTAERRIKEVGIRRVMGASVQNVVKLLSKDFLKLVLLANLIAWPLAWFALSRWLQDFAFRIPISVWVFIVSGLLAMLIALLTVSFQAIRAAVTNPVNSLRTE